MTDAESVNVARHLWAMAAQQPASPALRIPLGRGPGGTIRYRELSFAELAAEADAWAWRFTQGGVQQGDRVLVLVRPGLPLIAVVFALFKLGAPPIVIDPGMGRKNFLACVARSQPSVLVGIASARIASWIFRDAFRSVRRHFHVPGGLAQRIATGPVPEFPFAATQPDDLAAILFTSGSTGAPKGVCYEHAMFEAQVRMVRDSYGIAPGETDLPMLPVFALFNPALGMTTVVPQLDPGRPSRADPAALVQAIRQNGVTNSFGSPVIWTKIARHCTTHGIVLPEVRRILIAGAPVPPPLFAALRKVFPNAGLHSPYGATEALPVSTISAAEVIGTDERKPETGAPGTEPAAGSSGTAGLTIQGYGTCVGYLVPPMEARIIAIDDAPIASLAAARQLAAYEIGEIVVRGPVVTKAYDLLPEATARAKIYDLPPPPPLPEAAGELAGFALPASADPGAGDVWHRMGDAGYFDAEGRLWFCGRVAERVETPHETLFPDTVEPVFNTHPRVFRSALIGFGPRGKQVVALAVEPWPETWPETGFDRRTLARELFELGNAQPHTIRVRLFYFVKHFPVDVRHNSKIHRLRLANDLLGQVGIEIDTKR